MANKTNNHFSRYQILLIEDLTDKLTVTRVVALELGPRLLFFLFLHRSLKKHLTDSLASSRTSDSRDNAVARVCPICPGFVVDIQVLMFVFSKDYKKKRIKKQKRVTRHFK